MVYIAHTICIAHYVYCTLHNRTSPGTGNGCIITSYTHTALSTHHQHQHPAHATSTQHTFVYMQLTAHSQSSQHTAPSIHLCTCSSQLTAHSSQQCIYGGMRRHLEQQRHLLYSLGPIRQTDFSDLNPAVHSRAQAGGGCRGTGGSWGDWGWLWVVTLENRENQG